MRRPEYPNGREGGHGVVESPEVDPRSAETVQTRGLVEVGHDSVLRGQHTDEGRIAVLHREPHGRSKKARAEMHERDEDHPEADNRLRSPRQRLESRRKAQDDREAVAPAEAAEQAEGREATVPPSKQLLGRPAQMSEIIMSHHFTVNFANRGLQDTRPVIHRSYTEPEMSFEYVFLEGIF